MPIPANLYTNEVKNAAGTELEFTGSGPEGRTRTFILKDEVPSQQHRIKVQHQETGSGLKLVRRSNIRFDKFVLSAVDLATVVPIGLSITLSVPVGHLLALTEPKNVLAEGMSFLATTGAGTTVLFDCTGYGADALANGTL